MSDLIVHGQQALTVDEMKAQVNRIQAMQKHVMKEGEHYGKIPGCGDKKTLLKAGAEKILSTFGIAVDPDVIDLSTADEKFYRVKCNLYVGGVLIGAGVGECSSSEEKYKWKKPACTQEYEATDDSRKRMKWFKGWNGAKPYEGQQIRTEPADVGNTVLKMAKKRAMIDGTLTATAASDIFAQDLEDTDIPDSGEKAPPPPIAAPQPTGDTVEPTLTGTIVPPLDVSENPISEPQIKKVQAMLSGLGIKDEFKKHVKISELLGYSDMLPSIKFLSKSDASTLIKAIEAEQEAAK